MKRITIQLMYAALVCCMSCTQRVDKSKEQDASSRVTKSDFASALNSPAKGLDNSDLIKKLYYQIDEMHSGKVFAEQGKEVFYRVLTIPQEENIMVVSEKIVIGEEGSNYKLVNLSRLTDDGSVLPKFGINNVDSLRFLDSVRITGYFNKEKKVIDLSKLKE